jgi:hypothetical protein
MPSWLKSRLGTCVVAGTLAIGVVGGLAFAVAGPIMSSTVSSGAPQASPAVQAAASAGAATGTSPSAAVSPGTASGTKACAGRGGILRRLLGRTDHASLTVRGKGGSWVTVTLDRGTVKSISATSITIVRPDGGTVTAPITSSTKFRRATESSLAAGDKVVVVQEAGTTRFVIGLGKPAGGSSAGAPAGGAASSTT